MMAYVAVSCLVLLSFVAIQLHCQKTQWYDRDSTCGGQYEELNHKLDKIYDEIHKLKQYMTNSPSLVKEYIIFNEMKSFFDAKAVCQANGGDLVSLNTMEEFDLVVSKIKRSDLDMTVCQESGSNTAVYWTSAENVCNNVWGWGDINQRVLPTLWRSNEPNGSGNCGQIQEKDGYKVDDTPCESEKCFICETLAA